MIVYNPSYRFAGTFATMAYEGPVYSPSYKLAFMVTPSTYIMYQSLHKLKRSFLSCAFHFKNSSFLSQIELLRKQKRTHSHTPTNNRTNKHSHNNTMMLLICSWRDRDTPH